MAGSSCFSLVSIAAAFLRRSMTAAGLSSQTLDIDSETTIHFWGPITPAPSKPNLVLIHGFGPAGIWQWRHQVSFFAPKFNVLVPDLVFFGSSYTTSAERSEVFQATCMGKLLQKLGIDRYCVVGTSYGGFVAYWMGKIWGESVEKVVIASSAVNMVASDNAALLKKAKVDTIEELLLPKKGCHMRPLLHHVLYNPPSYVPDFILDDIISKLYCENRMEKSELLMGLSLGRSENSASVTPLSQPVLIIWGENDGIFSVDKAKQLHKLLGEKTKLEVITKTSHLPQIERPHKFNFILHNFCSIS